MNSIPDSGAVAAPPAASAGDAYDWRHGAACALVSLLIGLTQSLGINMVNANLSAIQGALGATAAEAGWLITAFYMTYVSSALMMTKVRLQFGLKFYTNLTVGCFLISAVSHLFVPGLGAAIFVRAVEGFAAAALSTLSILYMVQALPRKYAPLALLGGIANLQLGAPLARILPESLLQLGQWQGLNLLDIALAVVSLGAINTIALTPVPRQRVFNQGDLVSYAFYATALGLLCIVLTQGRIVWWRDSAWLGVCLALAVLCFGIYLAIDFHRPNPLIDLRWLGTPFMLRFLAALVLFRIVLSEQTVGVVGLLNALGMNNDQMHGLFALTLLSTLAGFVISGFIMATGKHHVPALLSLAIIAVAALIDAGSTSQTRPADLYFTQCLIGVASAMFFSSAMILGFGKVIEGGMKNIATFSAIFGGGQALASLAASAWFTTFIADSQKWHFAQIAQHMTLSDPQVAARLGQMTAALGAVGSDRARRIAQASATFAQQINVEAAVLAYDDLFRLIALVALLTLTWLLALRFVRYRQARKAAAQPVPTTAPGQSPS